MKFFEGDLAFLQLLDDLFELLQGLFESQIGDVGGLFIVFCHRGPGSRRFGCGLYMVRCGKVEHLGTRVGARGEPDNCLAGQSAF